MNKIVLNEIKELYASFDKTNSMYEKGYIASFFDYLKNVVPDDVYINDMCNKINKKLKFYDLDYIVHLLKRRDDTKKFIKNTKTFIKQNIDDYERRVNVRSDKLIPLNNDNISYILDEFLKSLDMDIYNYYHKLGEEGRILYSNDNNTAFTSLYNSNMVIFIEKLSNLEDVLVFVHELGHAYYFNLNNERVIERENIATEIKDEIPSKLMETKFIKFLEDNHIFEQAIILQDLFDSIIYECSHKRDDYDDLKYLIGADIAFKLKDVELDITEYFKHVYKSDIYTLISEKNNKKTWGKILVK